MIVKFLRSLLVVACLVFCSFAAVPASAECGADGCPAAAVAARAAGVAKRAVTFPIRATKKVARFVVGR